MPNPWYTKVFNAVAGVVVRSKPVRDEFSLIQAGFDGVDADLDDLRAEMNTPNFAVDGGAANAYVVSVATDRITAYTDGLQLTVRTANASTGASTINVNALGAKSIVRSDGSPLQAGDILANNPFEITYNGAQGKFYLNMGARGVAGTNGTNGTNGLSNVFEYEGRATGADVPLTAADAGKLVDITSGTFTQTIALKSTFTSNGDTSTLIYANSGSGIVTFTPTAPDTIDGNTTRKVYPNEAFILAPASGGWTAIVVRPMHLLDTAAGTWQPEPGYAGWWSDAAGSGSGGGGGGSGGSGSGTNSSNGGGGGAGGGGGGAGSSGQVARQFIDAARLAARITARSPISYAPGAGGAGGAGRAGAPGATSGTSGNTVVSGTGTGATGSSGNSTTFGLSTESWYSVGQGGVGGGVGGGPSSGSGGNTGGIAGTATLTAQRAGEAPDAYMVSRGATLAGSSGAAGTNSLSGSAAGKDGGAGGSCAGPLTGSGDATSGATAAPGGVGSAVVGVKPATPATPAAAPMACGGYGGGGGAGSAGVGGGAAAATGAGGDGGTGGTGGAGFIRIRGVL